MMRKSTFRSLILCAALLCGSMSAWGVEYTATFDASNCGMSKHDNTGKQYQVSAGTGDEKVTFTTSTLKWYTTPYFYLDKNVNAKVSWSVPDGKLITFTSISVTASAQTPFLGSARSWDVSTSVSGSAKESKSGKSMQTIDLTSNTYLQTLGNDGFLSITHGDTEMDIQSISFTYTLRDVADLEIIDTEITNQWHTSLPMADYIVPKNNPGTITIGASSDPDVATYDAQNQQFVLGHKSGTATFSVSAEHVAAKNFTITTNQSFYEYASRIISAAGGDATTLLANTTDQASAETVLADVRASVLSNLTTDKDLTCLLENPDFEYDLDWNYGWNGTTDEQQSGAGNAANNDSRDRMTAYQKKVDGDNTYVQMYRGNWGAYSFTLDAGNIYQDVTLPRGYYRLFANVKCTSNNNNIDLTSILYIKEGETIIGKYEKKATKNSDFEKVHAGFAVESNRTLTLGNSHNELKNSSSKEVAVDNFGLEYVVSYEEYLRYVELIEEANSLKDNVGLQPSTKSALEAAIVDINTLETGEAIINHIPTLQEAIASAREDAQNVAEVNVTNQYLYYAKEGVRHYLTRGANYGTRAIATVDNGLKLTVATNSETKKATFSFVDTQKLLFKTSSTTDTGFYTDYNNNGTSEFCLQAVDGGYKIMLAGDLTQALGIVNEDWTQGNNSGNADMITLVPIAEAVVWNFAEYIFAGETSIRLNSDGKNYYTTLSNTTNDIFLVGAQAATICTENDELVQHVIEPTTLDLNGVETEGTLIKTNTGVLVKGNVASAKYYVVYGATLDAEEDNKLVAGNGAMLTGGDKYYRLTWADSNKDPQTLGFYWGAEEGAAFSGAIGKAYLVLTADAAAPARFLLSGEHVATSLDDLAQEDCVKFVQDGKLYIMKNGVVYNALGLMIK